MRVKTFKVSQRVAIIILMAIFSIVGIIACGSGQNITGSKSLDVSVDTGTDIDTDIGELPDPDKTGPVESPDGKLTTNLPIWETNKKFDNIEMPKRTFPEDTYMTVYTPWRGENYPRVSWQDSETLLRIWKEMISKKYNKNARWFVKGASYGNWDFNPNRWKDWMFYFPPEANYYYFDKNFDIVYYKDTQKATLKIMKLVGAAIVRWNKEKSQGNSPSYVGTWTVGGIYQTILTHAEITGNNNDDLNFFTRAEHMPSRDNKPLQVINMNLGYNDHTFTEFGIDNYYNTTMGDGYYNNITQFTNKTPQELDEFLNCKINLSWQWNLDWHNWRFFTMKPAAWHLEAHPDSGWVKR